MVVESEEARLRRHHQRTLFDGAAELYDESRRGYPPEVLEFMVATAGLQEGSVVLEVGCGTGQLTEQLCRFGFSITAIDIGPSMVAVAQRRSGSSAVRFEAVSFEALEAADASFDLVVSATAFHWIDPDIKFHKAARLLRPGGWLALLATGERYDDPLGSALLDMWVARSDDGGAWVKQKKLAGTEILAATGLFGSAVEKAHSEAMRLPVEVVIGVESTRSTSLSWAADIRQQFIHEMRDHLRSQDEVGLRQETSLTMAQVS